jgi:hypothetical protein
VDGGLLVSFTFFYPGDPRQEKTKIEAEHKYSLGGGVLLSN